MTLSDARGVVLREEKIFSKKYLLQRNGLQSGVYFLEMMDEKGRLVARKLIIN
jgi:hypothetical protein